MQAGICHATDDQLDQYAMGALPEAEEEELEEHLLICPMCQSALALTDVYWSGMRGAARQLRGPARVAVPWFRRVFEAPKARWAVGLAALCLLVAAVELPQRHRVSAPPAVVLLEATRGADGPANASAPARSPFLLSLDLTGLPPLARYSLEIVDALGHPVFHAGAAPADNRLRATVAQGLPGGVYYVRLYAPGQELLREYALRVGD